MEKILYVLPEIFLSLSILILLMVGVFMKKSYKLVNLLTILTMLFAIALVINQPDEIVKIFNDSYIIDNLSGYMKILTLLFCSLVLVFSQEYIKLNK